MENIILVSFFQVDSLFSYIYSNQQSSYMFQKDLFKDILKDIFKDILCLRHWKGSWKNNRCRDVRLKKKFLNKIHMLIALWEKVTHCLNYSIYTRKKKDNTAWKLLEPGVLSQLYILYNIPLSSNWRTFKAK